MKVSIIVPTFNRSRLLGQTLESLLALEFPRDEYEILVVDNASTDDTAAIVERFVRTSKGRLVRYIFEPVPGLLSGRHRGAAEARGEILSYVDDDIVAQPQWLAAVASAFAADPGVDLVGGRCLPRWEAEPPEWVEHLWRRWKGGESLSYYSLIDMGNERREIDPNLVWGLNFSIRREALRRAGGFHPDSLPPQLQRYQGDGETGLTQELKRSGAKASYEPHAVVEHVTVRQRLTVEYLEGRQFFQGVCDSYATIRARHLGQSTDDRSGAAAKGRRLRRVARAVRRVARRALGIGSVDDEGAREMRLIKERMDAAYRRGYAFHQKEVADDSRLLDWVTRKDYFDYKLPD